MAEHHHGMIRSGNRKGLALALAITALFMVVEFVGGWLTNSLALMSDAVHMLADVVALALSLLALKMADKKISWQKSYGYRRFEVLAAFVNGLALIGLSGGIIWEAVQRFATPEAVNGGSMMVIAFIGLLANIASAWALFHYGDTSGNMNMRGAYLHVVADAAGSVGAIAAGVLMYYFSWYWADPLISVAVSLLILRGAWQLVAQTVSILLEAVPAHIDTQDLLRALQQVDGVDAIHDLHIWSLTEDSVLLTAHAVVDQGESGVVVLCRIKNMLAQVFSIDHVTIQIEDRDFVCDPRLCGFNSNK